MFDFDTCALFAQDAVPRPKPWIDWYFDALGSFYAIAIPLSALALFIGCCVVLARFKHPAVAASFVVFLPAPVLIGLHATLSGLFAPVEVLSTTLSEPTLREMFADVVVSLYATHVALMLSLPSYFVLSIGLFIKTLRNARGEII